MKKIVVTEYAERWASGGIESYILNIVKGLDSERFEIRIIVSQKESNLFDNELSVCGCIVESILPRIYDDPIKRTLRNIFGFKKYLKKHKCDILHLHICHGVAMFYAVIAKKIGIKKVIVHCHNADIGSEHRFLKVLGHNLGKRIFRKNADKMLACSDAAANWLFLPQDIKKGNVSVVKCIVDVPRFTYSETIRREMREKYGVADKTIYLHVGRMDKQKNHNFLLDIYRELMKLSEESLLLLIGEGELRDEIYDYSKKIGVDKAIIFIDRTQEMERYMSMADAFILPSLFEGNPIVGVEAQAAGLPCFFSSTITRQARLLSSTFFLNLSRGAVNWARFISEKLSDLSKYDRKTSADTVISCGYDCAAQREFIRQLYEDL